MYDFTKIALAALWLRGGEDGDHFQEQKISQLPASNRHVVVMVVVVVVDRLGNPRFLETNPISLLRLGAAKRGASLNPGLCARLPVQNYTGYQPSQVYRRLPRRFVHFGCQDQHRAFTYLDDERVWRSKGG